MTFVNTVHILIFCVFVETMHSTGDNTLLKKALLLWAIGCAV